MYKKNSSDALHLAGRYAYSKSVPSKEQGSKLLSTKINATATYDLGTKHVMAL